MGSGLGEHAVAAGRLVMQVTVLGSGSRGNAILIDGSSGALLVDCGFGVRALAKRFQSAHRRPDEVSGVVLTHEHTDHASGVSAASARWQWPIWASPATHVALAQMAGGAPANAHSLECGETVVSGFLVTHHAVPHDAADCRALLLTDIQSGARVGVVLDCGRAPDTLPAFLERCDMLVMESNHCPTMLTNGPYPWVLKERIRGGHGHLSNAQAGALLAECVHRGLRGVMLAHLSETNNTPSVARAAALQALQRSGWRRDALWVAPQRMPHAPVHASGLLGGGAAQLRLAL